MKKRIAAYCRVSTEKEKQEGSFEIQKNYYMNKIQKDPKLKVAGIYGDFGITGTSIRRRPGFQKLISDCEAGKVDEVWCKSISRFSRRLPDCMDTIRKLKDKVIPVIFEKEGINTMELKSEFLLNILSAIAQEESHSISLNLQWALEEKNKKGISTGSVSYGYQKAYPHKWEIDNEEAERVRYAAIDLKSFYASVPCSYRSN